MKITAPSVLALAALATPSFATEISGHIEVEHTFESADGDSFDYTTIDGQLDLSSDFAGSSLGYAFGIEGTHFGSPIEEGDINVFAALTYNAQFGTFAFGAPRTAIDSTISRVNPNNNTSYGAIYGDNLFGREVSKSILSADEAQQYGVAFETEFGSEGVIAASVHRFDTDGAIDNLMGYAFATTNTYGAFDLGFGVELLSSDSGSATTAVLTTAYNGAGYVIGADLNVADLGGDGDSVSTAVLYADYDVQENFTVGASYSLFNGDVDSDTLDVSLLGVNARYDLVTGTYFKAGLALSEFEGESGEVLDIAVGFDF